MYPPAQWLTHVRTGYVPFEVDGRSNDPTTCASVYGAQAFEVDLAGLIWGNDLVVRGGRWTVGDPNDCDDAAPGPRRLATVMREDPGTALALLRDRYRILLSRGIVATGVCVEDGETRGQLVLALGGISY
jgi:uncharacterized protein